MKTDKTGLDKKDGQGFRDILKGLSQSDFDGHTEFACMSPEQKLQWLSDCARFFTEIKRNKG
jgi:hypothetical protein